MFCPRDLPSFAEIRELTKDIIGVEPTAIFTAMRTLEVADTLADAVEANLRHQFGLSIGRFNEISGSYTIDEEAPKNSKVTVEIEAASIDTQDAKRDQHLRGPDFFDAKQFPKIKFESTSVKLVDAKAKKYAVTGMLSLHGKQKEATIQLELVGEKDTGRGYRSGYYGTFSLQRSDFGITHMLGGLSDNVDVTVSFEGLRE